MRFKPDTRSLHDRDVVTPVRKSAHRQPEAQSRGSVLRNRGRLRSPGADPESFERRHVITAVTNGYVRFDYHGWRQELFGD